MRVLITGANGLLGQKLVKLLIGIPEVEVVATSRGQCRIDGFDEKSFTTLDVEDRKQTLEVFNQLMPDVVIHTAAMTHVDACELNPDQCKKANVAAVTHVVAGCAAVGAHMVHLSTDFIFDGSQGPLSEEDVPAPINYYGQTKLEAEHIIMDSDISWSIARTVLVYGVVPGLKRSNIILWVKESLEEGKSIKVVDDQWRTPTLAEDLAMGCWLLAKDKRQGIFNISGEDLLTPYDMAQKVATYFHLDASFIVRANSSTFSQPANRPARTGFILNKAKEQLGYQPHSFDEGIAVVASQIA